MKKRWIVVIVIIAILGIIRMALREDQVATNIPLSGNLDIGISPATWSLLKNAFVGTLGKELTQSIEFQNK